MPSRQRKPAALELIVAHSAGLNFPRVLRLVIAHSTILYNRALTSRILRGMRRFWVKKRGMYGL